MTQQSYDSTRDQSITGQYSREGEKPMQGHNASDIASNSKNLLNGEAQPGFRENEDKNLDSVSQDFVKGTDQKNIE